MRLLFKLLLTGLLVLAIPLKAVAAVGMSGCAPGHGGHSGNSVLASLASALPAVHQAEPVPSGHDSNDAHHAHHMAGASHHADPDPADASRFLAMGGEAPEQGTPHSHAKCLGCAPCCSAAAPAPERQQIENDSPPGATVPFVAVAYVGIDADIPLRPPRSALA